MTSVTLEHAIAATRFGFGATPTDFAAMGTDPKAWLKAQTNAGNDSAMTTPLPSIQEYYESISGHVPSQTMASLGVDTMTLFDYELRVRARYSQQTTMPFRERFVHFWSNHFSISGREDSAAIAVAFEREAIRPKVMSRFEDMLLASSQHSLMLSFLDNQWSVGPHSAEGNTPGMGINENLGREIMELHTLGVEGGYTQADVTSFAKAITGWTSTNTRNGTRPYGRFYFEPAFHEPGPQTIMGKTYPQTGLDQGLAAIHDFATHPQTINHVCTKIAVAFHSDNPPASLVNQLKAAWTSTDGDLGAIARALVDAPEMWTPVQNKVKSTDEYWMSVLRAVSPQWPAATWMNMWVYLCLGAPPFTAPSPAGWPIVNSAWASPGALRQRLQVTINLSQLFAPNISGDMVTYARSILGPLLKPATEATLQAAPTKAQALAVLFMSPEFQRR